MSHRGRNTKRRPKRHTQPSRRPKQSTRSRPKPRQKFNTTKKHKTTSHRKPETGSAFERAIAKAKPAKAYSARGQEDTWIVYDISPAQAKAILVEKRGETGGMNIWERIKDDHELFITISTQPFHGIVGKWGISRDKYENKFRLDFDRATTSQPAKPLPLPEPPVATASSSTTKPSNWRMKLSSWVDRFRKKS